MTELNSYTFQSSSLAQEQQQCSVEASAEVLSAARNVVPIVRVDSKLILQNMEEVLNSVKKKHRQKHKRKREQKKLALLEAGSAAAATVAVAVDLTGIAPHNGALNVRKRTHKKYRKKSSQDKSSKENGEVVEISRETDGQQESDKCSTRRSPKSTNAFEIMMNARNKSIGSNTPGKAWPVSPADKTGASLNVKRKLKLQEWAEKKGGAKRKLEEDARAAYVDEQLETRTKRFKEMLVNGASGKSTEKKCTKAKELSTEKCKETTDKNKTRHPRARSQRVDSLDSVESLEVLPAEDVETAEFLAKLNSPTKKRDSLLGYFPKKESPGEPVKTPKRLMKRSAASTPASTAEANNVLNVQSGRPRRSCTNKARYDYDLEESPTKQTRTSTKEMPARASSTNASNLAYEEKIEIITLDDSPRNNMRSTAQSKATKLAPLFVRSMPKPSPDPEALKARQAFLRSGVPEKLRLEQEKQKQYERSHEGSYEPFPRIAHVRQLSALEERLEQEEQEVRSIRPRLRPVVDEDPQSAVDANHRVKGRTTKRRSALALSDCVAKDLPATRKSAFSESVERARLAALTNKRAIIKTWKADFEQFPTYKCYNQMREKYRYFSVIDSAQDTQQVTESFVVTRRTRRSLEMEQKKREDLSDADEEYKPPATAPNGEMLFSEKYKPLLFEQVLVNLNPVSQLREFLSNWTNGGSGGSVRNSQNLDDSTTDCTNDSTSSQHPAICNTVVLLGPVSSGKTNAVFALANEMNFNVLEINAGMKRTGKRLIQELQEATQSHQIRKDASSASTTQKSLLMMSLNGLKSKSKSKSRRREQMAAASTSLESCSGGDSGTASELSQSARKCLILIEDADIVFEQMDAGFTDAIYTLASSSKRPVIVVASNPNCSHLQRLMSQNTIRFSAPNALSIAKFLAVLSLIENCPIQLEDLISLYLYNQRDLRRTLLELQFFIQSGGDRNTDVQPAKKQSKTDDATVAYFASPRKRQFSTEEGTIAASVRESKTPLLEPRSTSTSKDVNVYMHRSLFEFYTVSQNAKWRLPFPVDFRLLCVNLNDVFQCSRNLKKATDTTTAPTCGESRSRGCKRKSRSPKKDWLKSSSRSSSSTTTTPLDVLCSFYENISVASLLDLNNEQYYPKKLGIEPTTQREVVDRLVPHLSENIAHTLLEKAIDINLAVDPCPYNLFDAPKESISLCDELGLLTMRTSRARCLDYEPALRLICRSERTRSSLERRSTRFYHYLRNYSVNGCNFSSIHFDVACDVLQSTETSPVDPQASSSA